MAKKSLEIIKKIFMGICIFSLLLGTGVIASNFNEKTVKVQYANGLVVEVKTNKKNVKEILLENNIAVLSDEFVEPEGNIGISKTIKIKKVRDKNENKQLNSFTYDEILGSYDDIKEKIIVEKKEIPFKTVNRDANSYGSNNRSLIVQVGENGLEEIRSRVLYNKNKEISRKVLSKKVIKKPKDKIVQLVENIGPTSRASSRDLASANDLMKRAAGRKPRSLTVNATAYCPCVICCGKTNGITASGKKAQAYHTIAASRRYPFGTIIYIDAMKNTPSAGWYIVEDRGGAIQENKIDIFYNTHGEALRFGRRYLNAVVYLP